MGVVGSTVFYRPVLHCVGNHVRDGGVDRSSGGNGFRQRFINLLGQSLTHHIVVKDHTAKHFGNISVHFLHLSFSLNRENLPVKNSITAVQKLSENNVNVYGGALANMGTLSGLSNVNFEENKINILFINFECRKIRGDFCAELTKCDWLVVMRRSGGKGF